jgi:hypothetical protein
MMVKRILFFPEIEDIAEIRGRKKRKGRNKGEGGGSEGRRRE